MHIEERCTLKVGLGSSELEPKQDDVDENGVVNASDALKVLEHAANKKLLSDSQQTIADMNGDGSINAADALEILKIAAGIK